MNENIEYDLYKILKPLIDPQYMMSIFTFKKNEKIKFPCINVKSIYLITSYDLYNCNKNTYIHSLHYSSTSFKTFKTKLEINNYVCDHTEECIKCSNSITSCPYINSYNTGHNHKMIDKIITDPIGFCACLTNLDINIDYLYMILRSLKNIPSLSELMEILSDIRNHMNNIKKINHFILNKNKGICNVEIKYNNIKYNDDVIIIIEHNYDNIINKISL